MKEATKSKNGQEWQWKQDVYSTIADALVNPPSSPEQQHDIGIEDSNRGFKYERPLNRILQLKY